MGKLSNNLSFVAIIIGVALNVSNIIDGSGGPWLQATLVAILINGAIGLYANMENEVNDTLNKIQRMAKILTPALFTTMLFTDNQILPDYWNFLPLAITILAGFTDFFNTSDFSSITLINYLHCAAEIYVAAATGDVFTGIEAITLLAAYLAYNRGEIVAETMPFAQYNYLTAAFMIELSQAGGGGGSS